MNLPALFNQFNLTNVRLNVAGIQVEVEFNQDDKDAAWELYVEMLTRIVTQPLPADVGDEKTALDSVFSLFATTREILASAGTERDPVQQGCHSGSEPGGAAFHRQVAPGKPGRCV